MSSIDQIYSDPTYDNLFPDLSGLIKPKNTLLLEIKKSKAVEILIKELNKIPELDKHRNDKELLKFAVNFIENKYTEKKSEIHKKKIICIAYQKLFNLNPREEEELSDTIEFLANNKQIKKLSIFKKYLIPFFKFILKNFL